MTSPGPIARPPSIPPQTRVMRRRAQETATSFLHEFGRVTQMFFGAVRSATRRPFEFREVLLQIDRLGVASLGIVAVTSLFIGMVMSTQFAWGLRKFGGMEYTSRVVALSFTRELAPTFTAVIVGGRIGAGMTAEIGSMAVTEQLDAVRALGADPIKKLVLPRLIASILIMPVLSACALVLGFGGAMAITDLQFNIPAGFFLRSGLSALTMADLAAGMFKTPFFGGIVALVGCHFGMITRGGTAGVGHNTTRTVVAVSIAILIADFFLTKLAIVMWSAL